MKAKRQLKKRTGKKNKFHFLNRKGQSLVEFSLVLVLIAILFIGLVNTVEIAYSWLVLQYAASEGSRFGSLGILDAGFVSREANIQSRVLTITNHFGLGSVTVQFIDQSGMATAGSTSEFFRMNVIKEIEVLGIPAFLASGGGSGATNPHLALKASTVIRNEPF